MAENFMTLLEKAKPEIFARLPPWMTPDRFWAMLIALANSEALQKIARDNPMSLIDAAKRLADWGLDLDGEEATIIPRGDKAVPTAMCKGMIHRAVEAKAVAHCYADLVYEADDVVIESGTVGRYLKHHVDFKSKKRGPLVGAYAVFILPNGLQDFELMTMDDIAAIKKAMLRNNNGKSTPAWEYFEGEQIKKSVLKRGLKRFRGAREGEAGERFAKMQRDDTFGTEVKVTTVADDLDNPPEEEPPPKKVEPEVEADPPIGKNSDDYRDLQALLESNRDKITMRKLFEILDGFGVEDITELPRSKVPALTKKLLAL